MAEVFNLLRRVKSLDSSSEQPSYSGVVIYAGQDENGNNIEYSAGNRTGTMLEITNEWGSQAQADAIYHKILGYRYQGYRASGTQIDPAAEIGDAVSISDLYGGVFSKTTTYGRTITSDLEAPFTEEAEHEFQVQSPTNRQYDRFTRSVRASLTITASQITAEVEARENMGDELRSTLQVQADAIEARVTKQGGDTSSFGWVLDAKSWTLKSGGADVFKATKDGVEVKGIIRATGGEIGGFSIQKNYLSYNGQAWNGTNTTGIYIGQSGIQCGSEANGVQITPTGQLYAESGYFRGSVNAGNIEYGGNAGYFDGSGLEDHSVYGTQIGYSTISTAYTSGGINTSLGYADFSNGVFNGWNRASQIACDQLSSYQILLDRREIYPTTISYKGSDGSNHSMNVVAWRWR